MTLSRFFFYLLQHTTHVKDTHAFFQPQSCTLKPKQNTTDAMSITLRTAAWQTVEKPFVKPVCTYFPFAEQQGKILGKAFEK